MQWPKLKLLHLCNNQNNSAENNIGSVGAKLLPQTNIPLLETLWLGNYFIKLENCKLGSEGVKHITKGKWEKLKLIYMCKIFFIQLKMTLVLMVIQQ
jgi:hypothetical protein